MTKPCGFTLMELLIALTLVSVLMTGVMATNTNLIHAVRSAGDVRNDVQNIYTTFDLFEKDILAFDGKIKASQSSDNDNEFIITFKRSSDKTGPYVKNGSRMVTKYIAVQNEDGNHKLYRKVYDPKFSTDSERILVTEQFKIEFRFLSNKKIFSDKWSNTEPPIQLHMKITDHHQREWIRKFPMLTQVGTL